MNTFNENIVKILDDFSKLNISVLECATKIKCECDNILSNNGHAKTFYNYCEMVNQSIIQDVRKPNFPEDLSEEIIVHLENKNDNKYIRNKKKDGKKISGDISDVKHNKKIEVKCYSSKGPTSFGPSEKWDIIYFIDARKAWKYDEIIIYRMNCKNSDKIFQDLILNKKKKETFKIQCEKGRRPRFLFEFYRNTIFKEYLHVIYNGSIKNLINEMINSHSISVF